MARPDPHSYRDDRQPRIRELLWRAQVDFQERVVSAEAVLQLDRPGHGPLDLDTRELNILEVRTGSGEGLPFALFPPEPVLGSRLQIQLPARTQRLVIRYRTAPSASALQWLSPEQTAGGQSPFLYSQCQAIHARSLVPLQDTPAVRMVYEAELNIPAQLRGLMAAASISREVSDGRAVERYRMPQPIPPYLFALAVGDLTSLEVGPRSRVWAEPPVLQAAAWEFSQVEQMIEAAEKLFAPYAWDRFDLLVLPPSFPYGGMENPRLAFLTPTLLAKDRSLVNVLAHELAHSWTGNLVTNANAEHFWLNEGFTVYAERRILQALEGPEMAALHAALGRRSLDSALAMFREHPELTLLRPKLSGIDPDQAFSQIPYEKGYLFLRTLEEAAGEEKFSRFLQAYVERFRFRSITSEDFLALLDQELPGVLEKVDAEAWLDEPGMPADAPCPRSERWNAIEHLGGRMPDETSARRWSPAEWQLYIESLPHPSDPNRLDILDQRYGLTQRANYEVLVSWLVLAAESNYRLARRRMEEVLGQVGRMKYLKPLYLALANVPETRPFARDCFERFRTRYHPIAQRVVEELLRHSGA